MARVRIWIICGRKTYEVERVSEELGKLGVSHEVLRWDEISLPLDPQFTPDVVWHRYEPSVPLIFQFCVLEELERAGVHVINSKGAVENSDKASIYLLWQRHLREIVEMPETIITRDMGRALDFVKRHGVVVFKPLASGGGVGVRLLKWDEDIISRISYLLDKYGCILLQKFIPNPNYDVRSVIIDGRVVASFARYNDKDFRHNIHRGARGLRIEELKAWSESAYRCVEMAEVLASKISEITGLEMYGLDLLPGLDGSVYLLEWNAFFGFEGLEKATGFNVAGEVARYIVKFVK